MSTTNQWETFEVNSSYTANNKVKENFHKYKVFSESIKKIAKSELLKRGLLDSNDLVSSISKLFKNASSDQLSTLFRKSDNANDTLILIWLSKVSHDAKLLVSEKKITPFKGIDKEDLKRLAKLSTDENVFLKLPNILAEKGIVLIYEPSFSGMKLDGAVFSIASGNPVIGISLRYSRLDHFWFTLMHELAHVHLHYDKISSPIVDDFDNTADETLIEMQANRLAKDTFVERYIWRTCNAKNDSNEETVIRFAQEINIHPAIIAGLLRKEKNKYDIYTNLINKIDVREKVFSNV